MIQGAMFSVVSAVEVSHNFRNPNPDHLHQDMMLNFFGSSQSCTWNRAKWTMTLERCYRVSKCFGSGSQDVPVKKIVLFPWKGRGWLFSPSYWVVNNVPGPHVYPHIDFAWIGSSPSMCEKNNLLFFRKASVFFKLLGNTMFQARESTHRLSLRGLEAVQACAKKNRSLKTCFSAKPRLHPRRPFIRGHATQKISKNESQRGIANLTYKQ